MLEVVRLMLEQALRLKGIAADRANADIVVQ